MRHVAGVALSSGHEGLLSGPNGTRVAVTAVEYIATVNRGGLSDSLRCHRGTTNRVGGKASFGSEVSQWQTTVGAMIGRCVITHVA